MSSRPNFLHRILVHKFLYHYAYSVTFTFGALLLFEKTNSIYAVLLFYLIQKSTAVALHIVALPLYNFIGKKLGGFWTMSIGAWLIALSTALLFVIQPVSRTWSQAFFYGIAVLFSIGSFLASNVSNALTFKTIGDNRQPGHASAWFSIAKIVSDLTVIVTGVVFYFQKNFVSLFITQSVLLFISMLPLRRVPFAPIENIQLAPAFRKLSKGLLFANINPEHELKVTALPLIIMTTLGSFEKSVVIVSIVALAEILLSLLAGKAKDGHKRWVYQAALFIACLSWVLYGVIDSKVEFIAVGIMVGLAQGIIGVGREARLGRELVNEGNQWEATNVIEFCRSFGMFASYVMLFGLYLLLGYLPQWVLMTSAIWILPKGIYTIGNVDKKIRAVPNR